MERRCSTLRITPLAPCTQQQCHTVPSHSRALPMASPEPGGHLSCSREQDCIQSLKTKHFFPKRKRSRGEKQKERQEGKGDKREGAAVGCSPSPA